MDKNTLLVKTDKGRDAMARRAPELGPRLRSMLILVDGKRNVAELDKLGAGLGGGAALLEQLLEHGWIAPHDPNGQPLSTAPLADSPPAPVAAPALSTASSSTAAAAPAATVSPTLPFLDARRLVVRFINDVAGPMGELTAIKVESCKTAPELQAQLPRVREALQNYRGAATVQRFDQEIVPQLPRH
ncbi:hypothetical protein [Hydrogenophaga pseudoflava]|jgi:hypothetical protein|uniref:hypothetical protein n=1 Tax=Hydrogenophaga pseudoflava TaxID=47421 RepID=UPI000824B6E7|nr:hypothetical protein [Hydrogenophaga pseudoflava]